jgi:hypothetical protein
MHSTACVQVIPGPAYLGPSSGKITIYEQRQKLLFEITRAQARASHQGANAAQVGVGRCDGASQQPHGTSVDQPSSDK